MADTKDLLLDRGTTLLLDVCRDDEDILLLVFVDDEPLGGLFEDKEDSKVDVFDRKDIVSKVVELLVVDSEVGPGLARMQLQACRTEGLFCLGIGETFLGLSRNISLE